MPLVVRMTLDPAASAHGSPTAEQHQNVTTRFPVDGILAPVPQSPLRETHVVVGRRDGHLGRMDKDAEHRDPPTTRTAGAATRTPRSLWETSNPLIRRSLARCGLSTLQDFLTPDLRWPTLDVFAATVYCATELPDPQGRNIVFLHRQLTQVFDRLFPHGVDTTLIEMPHTRLKPLLPWHASTPLKRHWFPLIPSKVLGTALATTTATPKTRHPLQRHVLTDTPSTTQLHDHANNLRKPIDPSTLDVTLRIWWRILPTHYFFWRQHSDPNLRHCAHGCNAIETYRHLLWECQHCSELWNLVLRQWWPTLHHTISWNQALFGLDLPIKSRWHQHSRSVLLAWNITRSIMFTILWQNRNQRKHQQEPPPDARTQWHWVDSRRRLHIRPPPSNPDRRHYAPRRPRPSLFHLRAPTIPLRD